MGYLISYPWLEGSAPPLDTQIGRLPKAPVLLYLHDLAIDVPMRGQCRARPIVDCLKAQARFAGWRKVVLVAVNEARGFWEGLGFSFVEEPAITTKLASYGNDARYMVRTLQELSSPPAIA